MQNLKRSPARISELEDHAGYWLRYVSNHVSHGFALKLATMGVTVAEWVLLRQMFGAGSMPPSRLAESTGLSRGAVSKLVDRLLHKGLLTREERTDDRRFQTIALTTAGEELTPKLTALADANDVEWFAALSAGEREALINTLKKLVQANGLTRIPTE